jgi:hypothetical protein
MVTEKGKSPLIGMIKQRAFVIKDIRAETIREIEEMISDSSSSKILEYDLWRESDGVQDSEVKVYLKLLRQIIADLRILDIEIFSTSTLSTERCTVSAYLDRPMEEYGGKSQFGRSVKAMSSSL